MSALGVELEELISGAQQEVLLVAPFVKVGTLARLINSIGNGVTLCCVTRWRPDEIALGVSDLEIWPLLRDRAQASLWLRPDLHAKYYRADNNCLVGSANMTATALGWSNNPNLELLVPIAAHVLTTFETTLLGGCTEVDDSIYDQTAAAVTFVRQYMTVPAGIIENVEHSPESEDPLITPEPQESWVPILRNPEDLFLAYSRSDTLTSTANAAAARDLAALPVSSGLTKIAFDACIGVLLLQKPIVRLVDEYLAQPKRFGAVRQFLQTLPCAQTDGFNAERTWQALMRWLFHFLPMRYEIIPSRHSEVVVRILS